MGAEHSRARRRTWLGVFFAFVALEALWSVASPLFSVPDEPSHTVRAAAAARGQLLGEDRVGEGPEDRCVQDVVGPTAGPVSCTYFDLPASFASTYQVPRCFRFQPKVPAGCAPPMVEERAVRPVATTAGNYPPLYYAVVGLPTVVLPSAAGVHLSRVMSGALVATLLASAVVSARSIGDGRTAVAGVLAATTPMTLYLGAAINPNGFEVAAAIGVWAAGASLLLGREDGRSPLRLFIAFSCLALSRPLSPLWCAVIAGILLLASPRAVVLDRLQRRDVRVAAIGGAVAMALAVMWLRFADPLGGSQGLGSSLSTSALLRTSLGLTANRIENMIGELGWLDTRAPALAVVLWLAAVSFLVGLALLGGRLRRPLVLGTLAAATVALPVVIEVSQADRLGLIWQGRYGLPIAVGIPILAASWAAADRAEHARRSLTIVAAAAAAAHLVVFLWGLRRYVVGVENLRGPLRWSPPLLPLPLLVLSFMLALAALLWIAESVGADRGGPGVGAAPET